MYSHDSAESKDNMITTTDRADRHDDHRPEIDSTVFPPKETDYSSAILGLLEGEAVPNEEEAGSLASSSDDAKDMPSKRIKILRTVKSLLTGGLSVVIAVFQTKVWAAYEQTKDTIPSAWPQAPNLLPTLLLLFVAVAGVCMDASALLMDACAEKPSAREAVRMAGAAHSFATAAKGVAFAITAVVCRGGFNYGKSTGTNSDLWSWTCSPQGSAMDDVNQAEANCTTQCAAWVFSIIQVVIEVLGAYIDFHMKKNRTQKTPPAEVKADK
ncbi:hypothetical protein BX600DRAFT_63539 [Xylariales sp. PMI_506]|nr:hypothetical protein BX600DRAFT_63539 [Xylariales sp. PMI_506]